MYSDKSKYARTGHKTQHKKDKLQVLVGKF